MINRPEDHENAHNYNFDHPNSLDFDLAFEVLTELLARRDCDIPRYDFVTHSRYALLYATNRVSGEMEHKTSSPIIIFEGILSLYDKKIRDLMDVKIFVLTDDDIRLARRCRCF